MQDTIPYFQMFKFVAAGEEDFKLKTKKKKSTAVIVGLSSKAHKINFYQLEALFQEWVLCSAVVLSQS